MRRGGAVSWQLVIAGSFLTQGPGRCRDLTSRAGICKALQSCSSGSLSVVALSRPCLSTLGGDLRHCSPKECHLTSNFLLQPALSAIWVVLLALRHPTDFSSMRPMWVLGKHPYIPSSLGEHTDLISALLFAHLDL